jgi:hypothetical protein
MTDEPSSKGHYDNVIDAIRTNCNKRFTSTRAVSMHLKMTRARDVINFINHGNYDN